MSNIYFYLLQHWSASMGNMPFGSIHRQNNQVLHKQLLFGVVLCRFNFSWTGRYKKKERVFWDEF